MPRVSLDHYLVCSDLPDPPDLPGLILSGLLAFFPSPMKWEKSSVCCSRYSNRFSAPALGALPAWFDPAAASGAGVGHDEDVVEDDEEDDSVDMMEAAPTPSAPGC